MQDKNREEGEADDFEDASVDLEEVRELRAFVEVFHSQHFRELEHADESGDFEDAQQLVGAGAGPEEVEGDGGDEVEEKEAFEVVDGELFVADDDPVEQKLPSVVEDDAGEEVDDDVCTEEDVHEVLRQLALLVFFGEDEAVRHVRHRVDDQCAHHEVPAEELGGERVDDPRRALQYVFWLHCVVDPQQLALHVGLAAQGYLVLVAARPIQPRLFQLFFELHAGVGHQQAADELRVDELGLFVRALVQLVVVRGQQRSELAWLFEVLEDEVLHQRLGVSFRWSHRCEDLAFVFQDWCKLSAMGLAQRERFVLGIELLA